MDQTETQLKLIMLQHNLALLFSQLIANGREADAAEREVQRLAEDSVGALEGQLGTSDPIMLRLQDLQTHFWGGVLQHVRMKFGTLP